MQPTTHWLSASTSISILFSILFYAPSYAQDTGRFFIEPEGLNEGATGADAFDSSIRWAIGDTVEIRWEAEWDRVTLKVWQGVFEGSYWFQDLLRDEPNPLRLTWTVAPVLEQAQDINMHFQLLNADNTEGNFNSKDFRIYNLTDVQAERPVTTTQERTVTREVTVEPSRATSSPTPTSEFETQTTPLEEPEAKSSTSSSSSATTTNDRAPDASSTAPSESTSSSASNSNSNSGMSETMKVGLGVGLGLGIPLIVLAGVAIYFLGRRHRKQDTVLESPAPPPPPPMKQPTATHQWYDHNGQVGGIESVERLPGGNVASQRGQRW